MSLASSKIYKHFPALPAKPQHVAAFYNMFHNAMVYFVLHIFVTRLCSYDKDYTAISCDVRKKSPFKSVSSIITIDNCIGSCQCYYFLVLVCIFAYSLLFVMQSSLGRNCSIRRIKAISEDPV